MPRKIREGRTERRWLDKIRNNVSERELSDEEAQDTYTTKIGTFVCLCMFLTHCVVCISPKPLPLAS